MWWCTAPTGLGLIHDGCGFNFGGVGLCNTFSSMCSLQLLFGFVPSPCPGEALTLFRDAEEVVCWCMDQQHGGELRVEGWCDASVH